MLIVVVAANLAVLAAFAATVLFPRLAFVFHQKAAFAAGLAIWVGGTLFRWYAIRVLGLFFTFDVAVLGRAAGDRSRAYRWVRHPP